MKQITLELKETGRYFQFVSRVGGYSVVFIRFIDNRVFLMLKKSEIIFKMADY